MSSSSSSHHQPIHSCLAEIHACQAKENVPDDSPLDSGTKFRIVVPTNEVKEVNNNNDRMLHMDAVPNHHVRGNAPHDTPNFLQRDQPMYPHHNGRIPPQNGGWRPLEHARRNPAWFFHQSRGRNNGRNNGRNRGRSYPRGGRRAPPRLTHMAPPRGAPMGPPRPFSRPHNGKKRNLVDLREVIDGRKVLDGETNDQRENKRRRITGLSSSLPVYLPTYLTTQPT